MGTKGADGLINHRPHDHKFGQEQTKVGEQRTRTDTSSIALTRPVGLIIFQVTLWQCQCHSRLTAVAVPRPGPGAFFYKEYDPMRYLTLFLLTIFASQFISVSPVLGGSVSDPSTYPLPTCAVCDKALDMKSAPVTMQQEGRELRFCGKKCEGTFKKKPTLHLKKLDQSIINDQLPLYPISTCLVTDETFGGDMGEPANYLHGNRLVRFCCMGCLSGFSKKPKEHIAKLDQAVIGAQLEDYPADSCPVTGQKLGGMGEPHNYVFAGRLLRFCCGGCIGGFNSNPTAALAAVYGDKTITK